MYKRQGLSAGSWEAEAEGTGLSAGGWETEAKADGQQTCGQEAGAKETEPRPGGWRDNADQMADRLENYVRALGIRGWKQWDCQWERQYRGSERLNLKELNAFRRYCRAH